MKISVPTISLHSQKGASLFPLGSHRINTIPGCPGRPLSPLRPTGPSKPGSPSRPGSPGRPIGPRIDTRITEIQFSWIRLNSSDSHCSLHSALLGHILCSHLGSYLAVPVALAIQVALLTQAVLEAPGDLGLLWQQCFVQWCLVNLVDLRESSSVLAKPRWKRASETVSVILDCKVWCQELYQCKVYIYIKQKSALGDITPVTYPPPKTPFAGVNPCWLDTEYKIEQDYS